MPKLKQSLFWLVGVKLGTDRLLLGVHPLNRRDHDGLFRHTGHTHTQMRIRKFYAFHCVEAVDNAAKDGVAGLARLGVEIAFQVSGDATMKQELQTAHAPGNCQILLPWAIAAARDQTKALFLQQGRVRAAAG